MIAHRRFLYSLMLSCCLFGLGCPPAERLPDPAALDMRPPPAPASQDAPVSRSDKSTLTLCQSTIEPPVLDPGSMINALVYEISQHIFNRLIKIDAAGHIVPDLAVSWEYINPQTLQFHLRRGVVFHNGEPLNAAAVKFSLERLAQPSRTYLREEFLKTVTGIRAVDNETIQIHTSAPDGLLLGQLAIVGFVYPPNYYRQLGQAAFGRHPVGTGPFQFQHWQPGRHIVLARNPRYWLPGVPKLERLVFRFIPGTGFRGSTWLDPLFTGQLDFIKQLPGSQTFNVQSNPHTKLIKTRSTRYAALILNPTKAPFSDIRLRQALALALDKDLIIRLVANGNGQKVALLSSDMEFGHNGDLRPYPYDPARARALVKEAGYPNGFQIRALTIPGANTRIQPVLARFLKDIGVEIVYDSLDAKQLRNPDVSKQYDLWISMVHNPLMHTAFLLNQFFLERPSIQLTSAYPDGFRERYMEMVSTLNLPRQAQLCQELERMAYGTYFIVPLFQLVETYGVTKSLVYRPSISGLIDLSEAYFQ